MCQICGGPQLLFSVEDPIAAGVVVRVIDVVVAVDVDALAANWFNDAVDEHIDDDADEYVFIVADDKLFIVLISLLYPLLCNDVDDQAVDDVDEDGDVPRDNVLLLSGDFGLLIREKNLTIAFFDLTLDPCGFIVHADVAANRLSEYSGTSKAVLLGGALM